MKKHFLTVSLLGLSAVTLLIFCSENPVSVKDSENSTAAYVPSTLVDVRVNKICKWYNSSRPDHQTNFWVRSNSSHYVCEGVTWMAPMSGNGTSQSLWRLYKNGDNMISQSTNEGGYASIGNLGKVYNSADYAKGILPMYRWCSNSGNLDHMLPGFFEGPSGYHKEGILGYAWSAGFVDTWNGKRLQENQITNLTAKGITVGNTVVWGGSTVRIKKNGVEYINRLDAGRELQSTYCHVLNNSVTPNEVENPTEGGDGFGNGSPIVNFCNTSDTSVFTQSNALRLGI